MNTLPKRMIKKNKDYEIKQNNNTKERIGMNTNNHKKETLKYMRKARWNNINKVLLEAMKNDNNKPFC